MPLLLFICDIINLRKHFDTFDSKPKKPRENQAKSICFFDWLG